MKVQMTITHYLILLVMLGSTLMPNLNAQNFTNFYDFSAPDPDTGFNSDGANPFGGLIQTATNFMGRLIMGALSALVQFSPST
jgi:hypothetical protein